MTDEHTRCIGKGCLDGPTEDDQPRPRWAVDGLLCRRHYGRLEQDVAELPARRDLLQSLIDVPLRSRGGSGGNRPTKAEAAPSEFPVAVHDHLVDLHATVVSWVRLVCEERGLRGPDGNDVRRLAPWLLSQLPWAAEQPWADDLAVELRDLSRTADSLTDCRARWNRLEAPCPVPRCGAFELGRWDGADVVQCAACGDTWPEADYPRLVKVLATDVGTSVSAAEAVLWSGVKPATFRQWVTRGLVRRLGTVDGIARYATSCRVDDRREDAAS